MTDDKWLQSADFNHLWDQLAYPATARQRRLLPCASSRRAWTLLPEECRNAILVGERYADGEASPAELQNAHEAMVSLESHGASDLDKRVIGALVGATLEDESFEDSWSLSIGNRDPSFVPSDRAWLNLHLLLEIVGQPEARRDVNQDWLITDVAAFAQEIYQQNRFEDISLLYDILAKSGCSNHDIMSHCKRRDGHVRGCWVIDLLRSH